jgi:CLIP-associating protein 1/2
MAVTAELLPGGRWLADAAFASAGLVILISIFSTAVVLTIFSFANMRSTKSLERTFQAMLPCFEGNESDQNWTQRQQSIDELRKLTKENIHREFPTAYLAGIKLLLDGIIKAAESLRTTLSANGCKLIKEIAVAIGQSLDAPMLEKLLPPMISLCGHTKTLNRKSGDEAVSAIVGNIPLTYRVLQHIAASANDKNFSTRMCTAGWLKIVIEKNGRHCEQHGCLDPIDQCIRTGLQDAKLDVREPMRDTYWTFAQIWPDRAESIMSSLDTKAQKMLDQHPTKPQNLVGPEVKAATTNTTSKRTAATGPAKPSIKEIRLAAQRARKAATESAAAENGNDVQSNLNTALLKEPLGTAPQTVTQGGVRSNIAVAPPKEAPMNTTLTTATQGSLRSNATAAHAKEAPATTAPQTAAQGGPRSIFTVTVGPTRNPVSQPALSSAAPKRALLSSAPVRRPRRPETPTEHPIISRHANGHSTTIERGRLPATAEPVSMVEPISVVEFIPRIEPTPVEHTPTVEPAPPADQILTQRPTHVPVEVDSNVAEPLLQENVPAPVTPVSPIPIVVDQENDKDTLTHKHTWNNKEIAERRRSVSPRNKDPEEARKLLARGIERIKSRSIDDHGYRKLQGLINYHDNIFQDEQKYDDMLLALLNALETPNTEKRAPLGRRFDNKFQILVTIRLMFVHNRKYFATYFPRAMAALVTARRNFESRNHIVSGLEETAQDITAACDPPDVIDAVMDVLETEERDEAGSRTVAMGLHILSGLSARMRALQAPLEPQQEQRMAKFALNCLREPTSIVRRAVIGYCLELKRIITPEARFFRLVTGDVEDLKNLITYYAANSLK